MLVVFCRQVILNQREGKFGLKTGVEGNRVLVTGVSRCGAAGRAGLRPGDQLITINGRTLTGLRSSEVQRIFRDCPPVGIKFTFRTRYQAMCTQYFKKASGSWLSVSLLGSARGDHLTVLGLSVWKCMLKIGDTTHFLLPWRLSFERRFLSQSTSQPRLQFAESTMREDY